MSASARRESLRKIAHRYRSIPGQLGLREHAVAVLTRTWSGAEVGQGTATDVTTSVTESGGYPPKVRWLNDEEIAVAGYDEATVEIGPITPAHTGGGTAIALLTNDAIAQNVEAWVILTGPEFPSGSKWRRIGFSSDRALRFKVKVQRVAD